MVSLYIIFGIGIDESEKIKAFDDTEFNVIVFDEIYLNDVRKLSKIKNYCRDNPDKIIIATGDTCQNEPVTKLTNQKTL